MRCFSLAMLALSSVHAKRHFSQEPMELSETNSFEASATPWKLPAWKLAVNSRSNESLLQEEWLSDALKPWSTASSIETKCEEEYSVKFKLASMHSFLTVPACHRFRSMESLPGRLKRCKDCDPIGDADTAEIHWNIPGCEDSLCKWPRRDWQGQDADIGPKHGLRMHPVCAWGIVSELDTVYRYPFRQAGMDGVMSALGSQTRNPLNWAKVLHAGWKKGGEGLASAAAQLVQWEKHLSEDCQGTRSRDQILKIPDWKLVNGTKIVKPIGAVCWNNVIDFRDLWCHYKGQINVTKEADCRSQFSRSIRR